MEPALTGTAAILEDPSAMAAAGQGSVKQGQDGSHAVSMRPKVAVHMSLQPISTHLSATG